MLITLIHCLQQNNLRICPSHVCLNGIAQYTYGDLRVGEWHKLNISDLIILPSRCIIEAKPSFPGVKLC